MSKSFPGFFYGLPLIALLLAFMAPSLALKALNIEANNLNYDNPVYRAALIGCTFVVLYACIFVAGPRLKHLLKPCVNSLRAACLATFAFGVLVSFLSAGYALLPLPALLLEIVAVLIGVVFILLIILKITRP